MTHFFANPLSIFCDPPTGIARSNDHIMALRSLPSFRNYVARRLKDMDEKGNSNEELEQLHSLLSDSTELLAFFKQQKRFLFNTLKKKLEAMKLIEVLQNSGDVFASTIVKQSRAELYPEVISGKLSSSSFLRDLIEFLAGMNRDTVQNFNSLIDQNFDSRSSIKKLQKEWHIEESSENAQYGVFLTRISSSLEKFFKETLLPLTDTPFCEVHVIDASTLYEDVYTPLYRQTIENALMKPSSYLGKLNEQDESDTVNQPLVCAAYSLYRESGSLINIYDFWQAFHQSLSGDVNKNGDREDSVAVLDKADDRDYDASINRRESFDKGQSVAWFCKAVNELRYLGFVKESSTKKGPASRNTVGVLQKLAWDGL